jgi:hypothetical protein
MRFQPAVKDATELEQDRMFAYLLGWNAKEFQRVAWNRFDDWRSKYVSWLMSKGRRSEAIFILKFENGSELL